MDFISESEEVRPSAAEAFCFYRLERSGVPDYEKMRQNVWKSNCTYKIGVLETQKMTESLKSFCVTAWKWWLELLCGKRGPSLFS